MLEELELLIPLLEGVTDGAIFAFVVYMISHVMTSALGPLSAFLSVLVIAKSFVKIHTHTEPQNSQVVDVQKITWGRDKSSQMFQSSESYLEELFDVISGGARFVWQ